MAGSGNGARGIVHRRSRFFRKLLCVLRYQLSCIETDFFREVEYSSGEGNFLIAALRRMCDACERRVNVDVSAASKRKRDVDDDDGVIDGLTSASRGLRRLVRDRFGLDLSQTKDDRGVDDDDDDDDMETDALWSTTGDDYGDDEPDGAGHDNRKLADDGDDDDEDDDSEDEEDGPVIIPYDQIEASIARSALQSSQTLKRRGDWEQRQSHRDEYPLLYAAMSPGEDEVMACARILDEAKDVSLVREAATYLEEVEVHHGGS